MKYDAKTEMFQQEDTSPKSAAEKQSLEVLYTAKDADNYNKLYGYSANDVEFKIEGSFKEYKRKWMDISKGELDWKSMRTANTYLN